MNRFMFGRYGMDDLNRFIMYLSLALVIINLFARARALSIIVVLLLIILYARSFSRSIYNRQQENLKYLEIRDKFLGTFRRGNSKSYSSSSKGGFKKSRAKAKDDGKRVLICPYCKEKLRVPVGAGKIKIRCPHCNREFEEIV